MKVDAFVCADWSKEARKRAVYAADVRERRVFRLACPRGWSVGTVLDEAERFGRHGCVLASFDAPLGVPESYLAAVRRLGLWGRPANFLEFLKAGSVTVNFFEPTKEAKEWSVERPFFSVPKGVGGLTSYQDFANAQGVDLWRSIDRKTKAKPLFVKSGIPGSVGCAAESLWREMAALQKDGRRFKLWPFEGDLEAVAENGATVIAEMYPRAAYATVLSDGPVAERSPISLAKTDGEVRRLAIAALAQADWVSGYEVKIDGLAEAQSSEDDFDACITAAALLRCELEGWPFCAPGLESDRIEGGIVGMGSVNFDLAERNWRGSPKVRK